MPEHVSDSGKPINHIDDILDMVYNKLKGDDGI